MDVEWMGEWMMNEWYWMNSMLDGIYMDWWMDWSSTDGADG